METNRNMKKYFVSLIFIFFFPIISLAQLSEESKVHVIIGFDNLVPFYSGYYSSQSQYLQTKLEESISLCTDAKELSNLSFINFSHKDPYTELSPVNFAEVMSDKVGNHVFPYPEGRDKWQTWVGRKGGSYSFLSIAKQECLHAMFSVTDKREFNRVFLLLVTDEHYNANDSYNKEISDALGSHSKRVEEFEREFNYVSDFYRFKYIGEVIIENTFKIAQYEILPNSISLGSVVDIPADFGIERVRGGYSVHFKAHPLEANYTLKQIKLSVEKGENQENQYFVDSVGMKISSKYVQDGILNITLRGWLQQNDSVYGAIVMNPYDKRYTRHLTIERKLSVRNSEKVLGLFPLWDMFWWWFPNDLHFAVLIWDIILIIANFIMICIVAFRVFRKITCYVPDNKDITLSKI